MVRKIHILIVLVLLLAPLCVEGQNGYTQHGNKVTWHEAQAICEHNHSNLLSILDSGDTDKFYNAYGWIGLYYDSSQDVWKWIREGAKANFVNWEDGTPGTGECAYKHGKKTVWHAHPCTDARSFMCYGNKTILVKEKKTWEEALQHCRSLEAIDPNRPATDHQNHRYDLVSLLIDTDHSDAQEKAQRAATDEVWTGLRFLAGSWMWLSGEKVHDSTLPQCPAADLCGTLGKSGNQWYQRRNCDERRNFICKYQ